MRIDKAYQIGDRDVRIDLRGEEKKQIIVTPRYMCMSKYEHQAPAQPTSFTMLLRKHLLGAVIKGVEQHRFDRIVEISLQGRGKIILEFFSRGNFIVIDENGVILAILEPQEWKDRTVKVGTPYRYPPDTPDIKNMPFNEFLVKLSESKEIVKVLATDLGLGAIYANEILLRAGVGPDARANRESAERVHKALNGMLDSEIDARIVLDENAVDAVPFEMQAYASNPTEKKASFNEAIDDYFTNLRVEGERNYATRDYSKELERVDLVIKKQKQTIEELEGESARLKDVGDSIYANFQEIDSIMKGIAQAKREGKNWMKFLEEKGLKVSNPAERKFGFAGAEISIDKSVTENASWYYDKSKKARAKLEGATRALKESEAERANIELRKSKTEKRLAKGPVEKKKAEWFEKFRWFISSDGFLVIGGKDAGTNEVLIKKHTDPSDLVLHSSVRGAPFFIIKNPEKKEIPETTKQEAAEAAASYSSAWGDELGSADVYAMRPEQVTKTPQSGEYLTRGAFVIRGEREWFKGIALKVAIGFILNEDGSLEVIGGPESAVRSRTKQYVRLGIGGMKSGDLAAEVKANILRRTNKEDGQRIKKAPLGEIQKWVPSGKGMILK
jgi:predicted ribosome quality control (RQC) complex YloA/Tae2 family protein